MSEIKIYKVFNAKNTKGAIEEGVLLRKDGKAFLMIRDTHIYIPENENILYEYETEVEQRKFFEVMLDIFGNKLACEKELQSKALSMCNTATIKEFMKEFCLMECVAIKR